jgi:hypothetical protein
MGKSENACLAGTLRVFNVGVALIGLALLSFGLFLTIELKSVNVLSGVVLGLGVLDTAFGVRVVSPLA